MTLRSALGVAVLGLLIPTTLASCGQPAPPEPPTIGEVVLSPDAVVVVAGATQNVPAPRFDGALADLLGWAMLEGVPVDVVLVAGTPEPLDSADLDLRPMGGTAAGNKRLVERNLEAIEELISRGPATDGADYLDAITTAHDVARSRGATAPVIAVVGSGLSDSGALPFTAPGMLGADADEVVSQLLGTGAIRENRLTGATVVLSSTGWTSAPQPPLSDAQRRAVATSYAAVVEAMGAVAVIDPAPRSGSSVGTSHTVETVAVPSAQPTPSLCSPTEVVFDNQSAVSFVARQTTFVDSAAANAALDELVDWLLAGPGRRADIRGTTADDGSAPEALRAFGELRAQAVADYLVSRGVSPEALSVVGVGADFPEYVRPDRDALGNLLPGPATLNRSVRIRLTASC